MAYIKGNSSLSYGGLGKIWGFGDKEDRSRGRGDRESFIQTAMSASSGTGPSTNITPFVSYPGIPVNEAFAPATPSAAIAPVPASSFTPAPATEAAQPAPVSPAPTFSPTPTSTMAPVQTQIPLSPFLYPPGYMMPGGMPLAMPQAAAAPVAAGPLPLSIPRAVYISGKSNIAPGHLKPNQYQIQPTPQQARLGRISSMLALGLLFL